jgi:hypothetical protein
MVAITLYVVQCPSDGSNDPGPHIVEFEKTRADSNLSGSNPFLTCFICKQLLSASLIQGSNTIVTTT